MWIDAEERLITGKDKTNAEKVIVATGATSGIGYAAAQRLARAGVTVIGVGRSEERCRACQENLRALGPGGKSVFLQADLARQSEVIRVAGQVRETLSVLGRDQLDGLLNNAGGFSFWLTLTPEGLEHTWALNHLAPFRLSHELLPLLQAAPAARIVTVSSGSHRWLTLNWSDLQSRRDYNGLRAYGRSKLANVLFTLEWNRRQGEEGTVPAFAADPGLVRTKIGTKGTPAFVSWAWILWSARGITPEETAKGIVRLLLDPDVQTGAGIYWKHGRPLSPDPAALDADSARRLWEISERMCGLTPTLSSPV
ncbi:MAG: SDR family NAD(P)-dependent oxidoreductase [Anaerolineales bacterium]|nr:SDR family NAD(P)-dependent oxidoreductase [Anaerolineales bacterium]